MRWLIHRHSLSISYYFVHCTSVNPHSHITLSIGSADGLILSSFWLRHAYFNKFSIVKVKTSSFEQIDVELSLALSLVILLELSRSFLSLCLVMFLNLDMLIVVVLFQIRGYNLKFYKSDLTNSFKLCFSRKLILILKLKRVI